MTETFLDYELLWELSPNKLSTHVRVTDTLGDECLVGWVKWDGCSDLHSDSFHLCGPDGYKKHFSLMRHVYLRAFQLMEREPDEPWDEPTTLWTA